ncbi:MAG: DUF1684 domain-containing protein [Bacteroidia bacterium]|nr:DUF1684 domain-containing protein [Bacteroidia bacterium]MCX7764677.1 DUF1684 domain-containing protein [Bacteroidia bacterium]MDW8057756.1 DUF1684 domain-containing protein [Bacteroidia bacterium]
MRRSLWIGVGILLVVIGVLIFPRRSTERMDLPLPCEMSWQAYARNLKEARAYKDSIFRASERSPIPLSERERFGGLRYFEPDSVWRVHGRYEALPHALAPVIGAVWVNLPSLDSCRAPTRLLVYGGKKNEAAYIAFWDSTAAQGLTYEGGRYVPVEIHDTIACIDFNRAYFPYCAYNPNYICLPYPPQNRLCLSIKAGERW